MDTISENAETPETKVSATYNADVLEPGKFVTPQKHTAEATPDLLLPQAFKSPLNFSTVTVEQLGITPESFTKNSSGKSLSSYLKKSRRRSTVGARGSPETNHLIRFIAQQRNLKNAERSPLAQGSDSVGSPALYRGVSSLRERISAFQSAFHSIQEDEKAADCPEPSQAEGRSTAAGLARKKGPGKCWEPGFPGELSSKRRRLAWQSSSEDSLGCTGGRVTGLQTVGDPAAPPEKSTELSVSQSGEFVPLPECTEASTGLIFAECTEVSGSSDATPCDTLAAGMSSDTIPGDKAPAAPVWRDIPSAEASALRSVLKKPSIKQLSIESLQAHQSNLCDNGTHSSLALNFLNCCEEQKAVSVDQGNGEAPAFVNMRKRKRVTFGEDLSPELFDESLPANTPLRRGGTPARQKELSCVSPLLLEEPLVLEQLPQPDFDDKEENLENIEPLQISLTVLSPKKSSISETLSGTDDFSSSSNHTKIPSHNVRRLTRTSNRRTQLVSFTEENICNAQSTEVQPYKEKKINRKKCQETKRTNKVLPKKKQVLKSCRKKKGRGKKVSQKSLYGERDIASKKPLLSPIPELPEGSEGTPVPPGIQRTDSDHFILNGQLEGVKLLETPVKSRNLLSLNPGHLCVLQGCDRAPVSESHCPSRAGSPSPTSASEKAPDTRTLVSKVSAGVPGAADKWEREDELKTKVENESGHSARASETEEHVVACGAAPRLTLQCREFSVAGQNEEELKLGTQDTFLVVTQGKQQCGVGSAAQKEFACLQDASLGSGKGPGRDREGVESPTAERGGVAPGGGRKCGRPARRRSACHSGAHSGHWERNGDRRPACVDSSAVRLGSAALCEELAASVEQAVQSRRGETRVRRSTRLQKDAEDQGLVWLSLPVPSSSQKNRRRTIGAFDSRALESLSPAREAAASGPPGASSHLPGKRRKSFCASALAGSQGAPQPPRFCLGSLEREGEGSYGSWKGSTLGES